MTRLKPSVGLLISLTVSILMIGGLELIGYLWESSVAQGELGWTLVASRRLEFEKQGRPDRPYQLMRPGREYSWSGINVQINSQGLRDEKFSTVKPGNTYRILNVGDSVAFGWNVQQDETYGKQLQNLLSDRSPQGRRYEVLNTAVPGWTLEAERNFLLDRGLAYQPDLVLLDVTLVNDVYARGLALSDDPSLFDWLRDKTYSWPFLTTQLRFLFSHVRGPEAIPVLNPPRNPSAYYPLDESNRVWREDWALISEMEAACRTKRIPFIVVLFPTAFQLNRDPHPDTPQQVFGRMAKADGTRVVNLLPAYQEICRQNPPGGCEGYQNALFVDVWMHPSPLGHRAAAESLLELVLGAIQGSSG